MRVVVMGAGRVGGAIAEDLARDPQFEVTVVDAAPEAVARVASRAEVRTVTADLRDPDAIVALAGEHDMVLGCLPSTLGYAMLRASIEAGTHVVDISFLDEDPKMLDAKIKRNIELLQEDLKQGPDPVKQSYLGASFSNTGDKEGAWKVMIEAFEKVRATILSCTKRKHFPATRQMIILFYLMYGSKKLYDILGRFYDLKRGEFEWF